MVYYENLDPESVKNLLNHYGIKVNHFDNHTDIPHSFWGNPEAGRLRDQLFIRGDTPIHSVLHEACHYICMPAEQRSAMLVDAKGTAEEENATCYLQILLAGHIVGYSRTQILKDMDDWGYSFRLGSAFAWFTQDAQDTQTWLINKQIINQQQMPTWKLRNS
ncbi:MAG: hypothetical protein AB8B92_09340 [Gammaproteobacteria bacterium]